MARWRVVAQQLVQDGASPVTDGSAALFRQRGSLMVAHGADLGAAQRVLARLEGAIDLSAAMPRPQTLTRPELLDLEPMLEPQLRAWLLPGEGQVLPAPMLAALAGGAPQVDWRWRTPVAAVEPGRLVLADGSVHGCDLAIDVRGLGARPALPLRGVRGELVWLHAPGVRLARPVRLLHPRHRVYIVPRPGDVVVIGASEIESEDRSGVSLRSGVELMAAAHSVIPALAEARICHLETNLRPALPDNEPRIDAEPGLLRINGLFRHGWLLAPALAARALAAAGLADPLAPLLAASAPPA
jgi:glycine oxidase